jgi:PAS domain S-box-containing protein
VSDAEDTAHEVERRRYLDLLDLVPVPTLMTTQFGLIQQANRAAADLLGVPPNELMGRSLAAFILKSPSPLTFLTHLSRLKKSATGRLVFEERLRAWRSEPFMARLTVSTVRDPGGEVAGLQWVLERRGDGASFVDAGTNDPGRTPDAPTNGGAEARATAEQRSLALARSTEAYYRSLFDGALDAIVLFDRERRIVDANPAAHLLFGYAGRQIRKLRLDDLVDGDAKQLGAVMASLERDGSWRDDLDARRKDGATIPVEAAIATVTLPSGVAFRAAMRDITDRRRQHDEDERARRDVVAMIGHELMNPLNGIQLHAELLKMLGSYRESSIEAILTSVRQEQRLVDDLLELGRTDARHLRLHLSHADLLPLLRCCIAAVRDGPAIPVLRLDGPAVLPYGFWDQGRIMQVFHNLLANAVKYAPSDSEIYIRVEDLDDRVLVSVVDQGAGIDADALPHVFDRFFRAGSAKEGTRGLGLGLYVARTLVEAHGGTISAESVVGRGSEFRVTLPYLPPTPEHPVVADLANG